MFKKIFLSLVYIGAILLIYTFIEPFWFRVNTIQMYDDDIPRSFKDFRIVFISDIHHGRMFPRERIQNVVQKINVLKPDIVFLGGDYIQGGTAFIKSCFKELSQIEARHGVYGVLGNHDHWGSAKLVRREMKRNNIVCLDNKGLWIEEGKDRIKIGGVGDLWEDNQRVEPTIFDVKKSDYAILLSHNPDFAEYLVTNKIDIMLSGHTHGGQINIFGLYAPVIPSRFGQKYCRGIVDVGNTQVFITTGIGSFVPLRFFARPEIMVLVLK